MQNINKKITTQTRKNKSRIPQRTLTGYYTFDLLQKQYIADIGWSAINEYSKETILTSEQQVC